MKFIYLDAGGHKVSRFIAWCGALAMIDAKDGRLGTGFDATYFKKYFVVHCLLVSRNKKVHFIPKLVSEKK